MNAVYQGTMNKQLVRFADGTHGNYPVFAYMGAAMKGDPTAYVYRAGRLVWVKPGESVAWVEA